MRNCGYGAAAGGLRRGSLAAALASGLLLAWSAPAAAEPPPWAPAHGYRAKQRHARVHHHHYYERTENYISPLGVDLGRCNREAIGMLLGGATGAAAGAAIVSGDAQIAAIIGGAIVGVLAGGAIGRGMDKADGYCVAQTFAHGNDGETVIWRNSDAGSAFHVTPTRSFSAEDGRYCREYTALASIGERRERVHGVACLQPDGSWQLRS